LKLLAKKILFLLRIPIDLAISLIAIPAALVLLAYRLAGSARLPWTSKVLKKISSSLFGSITTSRSSIIPLSRGLFQRIVTCLASI